MARPAVVLVVEPDRDARELYQLAFNIAGVTVATASTGAEAVAAARDSNPRVVLMELRLPDADGLALAADLARSGTRPQIVAMSADLVRYTEAVARRAGCAAFLPKPCLPDLVVSEVRHSLR